MNNKVVVILTEQDVQAVAQAVMDRDARAALEFLERVLEPRVRAARDKGHCRPVFEWDHGEPLKVQAPPLPKNQFE